jgi:hypothetical protein
MSMSITGEAFLACAGHIRPALDTFCLSCMKKFEESQTDHREENYRRNNK